MLLIKRLYDYVLSWAEKKHSQYALSAVAFTESVFFPIPADPLLIALCLGKPERSLWFAFLCSFFSVLGACAGYLTGLVFWGMTEDIFFTYIIQEEAFEFVQLQFQNNAFLAVLGAAFTPIPFKVFTVAAGVFEVSFLIFLIAASIGRSTRFFIEAVLILFYGKAIRDFIEKYFNLLTLLAFIIFAITVILLRNQ